MGMEIMISRIDIQWCRIYNSIWPTPHLYFNRIYLGIPLYVICKPTASNNMPIRWNIKIFWCRMDTMTGAVTNFRLYQYRKKSWSLEQMFIGSTVLMLFIVIIVIVIFMGIYVINYLITIVYVWKYIFGGIVTFKINIRWNYIDYIHRSFIYYNNHYFQAGCNYYHLRYVSYEHRINMYWCTLYGV